MKKWYFIIKRTNKLLETFNNRINVTEKKLLEKETEFNNLKLIIYNLSDQMKNTEKNLKQKIEEISEQNIVKYNKLNANINNNLKQNMISLNLLNNTINNIEKELKNIDEKNFIQNKKNLDLLNNTINQIENKFNKYEYNLGILVYFNIRIFADFYINNEQTNLCAHNYYGYDKLDDSRIKLISLTSKCIWDVQQNGNLFEFTMNSKENIKGWKIKIFNNNIICAKNILVGSFFSLESSDKYKYYKIKAIDTGEYFYVDINKKRDSIWYFMSLTKNKELATDFMIKINQ